MTRLLNRRITSRNSLYLEGRLTLKVDSLSFYEQIYINNISLRGVQAVFSNNDLLQYIFQAREEQTPLTINFNYNSELFEYNCLVNWLKIYNIGERNFYALIGLNYLDKESFLKASLIELIYNLQIDSLLK